tara:strand:- start:2857 stop:3036 length:180 start_codon:yes stop_codon:yes gene_type:complete
MKPGDLVKWTFAKTSSSANKENSFYIGMLLEARGTPEGSWYILLRGSIIHSDSTEIELI